MKGRVLLIAPVFYSYHNLIIEAIKKQSFEVDFVPEREYSFGYNVLNNISGSLAAMFSNLKLSMKLSKKKVNYEIVLIIRGQHITNKIIDNLKDQYPKAHFVFYQWDSFKENPNALKIFKSFDKVYSFDRLDCESYKLEYKPLFYFKKKESKESSIDLKYDISFIGGDHGDRFEIINQFREICKNQKLKGFFFLKMNKFGFYKKKYFKKSGFKGLTKKSVSFESMPMEETQNIFNESKAVLDINNDLQAGLTMRTFEVLCQGKKLITTNSYIKLEPFYNPAMICIIDRKNSILPPDFINTPMQKIDMGKYHIDYWINDFISG